MSVVSLTVSLVYWARE